MAAEDMMPCGETETCALDAKPISERISKIVSILERYLRTRGAAGNIRFDIRYREAARASTASTPFPEENRPPLADNSVRIWQEEAYSHFRKSSWKGELLLKPKSSIRITGCNIHSTEPRS